MLLEAAPSNRPTSSVTAANTSSAGAAVATSVATRRSAACSCASRPAVSRAVCSASSTCSICIVMAVTRAIPRSRRACARDQAPRPARASTNVAPVGYSMLAATAAQGPIPGSCSLAPSTSGLTPASSLTGVPSG